jgi:arylsulfatase A-like enzyme
MGAVRNILFIMCDQLRADHLGCYGHPFLATTHLDELARRGVRFDRAFVQSGVCGPSRMSFYTGRYVASHGATWNRVPLSVGEITLGEYLGQGGRTLSLAGKTHVTPDRSGIARLHLDGDEEWMRLIRAGGFDELVRHDGHHSEPASSYAAYLRRNGYGSEDPWSDYVISAVDDRGSVVSGWNMRNARLPARVAEVHSETAYTTERALEFMRARGDEAWTLHLSYVKPHWPYMAPAPYHARYSLEQCLPVKRHPRELDDAHPVLAAYRQMEECSNFMRDEVWQTVRPTYQGLVQQIDDHLGRILDELDRLGRWKDTLIVFTADHGDYLGDHWLGEKEHFHDTVQRVPLIVYDPDPAADATRGHIETRFAEGVDMVPTFLEALGLPSASERIEGRSLLTLTRAAPVSEWRESVFSELDYGYREARRILRLKPDECRAWMVRTDRWKYVHWLGFAPQLFDLDADPDEYCDLGRDSALESVRRDMHERLLAWFMRLKRRVTVTDDEVEAATAVHKRAGVFFGQW